MPNIVLRMHRILSTNEMAIMIIVVSLVFLFLMWINNPWKDGKKTPKNINKIKPDITTKVTYIILMLILIFGIYLGINHFIKK